MDLSFKFDNKKFNYRVCGIIINNNKLLAMKDGRSPYFYLPGGRVQFGETAENAILRELREELSIDARIVRPLFLSQSFFNEDVTKIDFHELCLYFLIDISHTSLPFEDFLGTETAKKQQFYWLDFDTVKKSYLYPLFIKDRIDSLPANLEILTEYN
ncbi:MAG: NUDIX domain-containing protein [Clostridia bacterium]|nr:NUDIX domain-containing protein [Clostridia bacterium]